MEESTTTNGSTYEITFRFKSMREMNKFTIAYDEWRDEITEEENRRRIYNNAKREKRREKEERKL